MERRREKGWKGGNREDEDGGRWSGGKVRAVTEVEIEQEGRRNSIVFYRKVDDSAKRKDKGSAERELLWISFVSALNSYSILLSTLLLLLLFFQTLLLVLYYLYLIRQSH